MFICLYIHPLQSFKLHMMSICLYLYPLRFETTYVSYVYIHDGQHLQHIYVDHKNMEEKNTCAFLIDESSWSVLFLRYGEHFGFRHFLLEDA